MLQTRMVLSLPPAPLVGAYCVNDISGRSGHAYQCPPDQTCANGCCELRDGLWYYGAQGWIDYCPQTGEPLKEPSRC